MHGPDRYPAIKEKIKAALKEQRLTYAELGEQLGLSQSGVKKIFNAKDISFGRLEQICGILQLPLSELLDPNDGPVIKMVELDAKAEEFFSKNKSCFEFYFLLVTDPRPLDDLLAEYGYSKKRAYGYLRELERLGFVRWLPGDKVVATMQGPWLFRSKGSFVRQIVGNWAHEMIDDTILARHSNERNYFTQRILYLQPESAAELQREISDLLLEFTRRAQREKKQRRDRVRPVRVLGVVAEGHFVKKQKT